MSRSGSHIECRPPLHEEVTFHCDGNPMEEAQFVPVAHRLFGAPSGCARTSPVHVNEGVERSVVLLDSGKEVLGDFDGGQLPLADHLADAPSR